MSVQADTRETTEKPNEGGGRTPSRVDLGATWAAAGPPPLRFILPGLVQGTVGNLVAAGGCGKTFVMLATALGVAVGADVCDIWDKAPEIGRRAVYLSLEDPEDELKRRLWALGPRLSAEMKESAIENLEVLSGSGLNLSIRSSESPRQRLKPQDWFQRLSARLSKKGNQPSLVVIDTLNRLLGGFSENDAGEMSLVLGEIEAFAKDLDAAVVLCHHISKGAQTSGTAGEAHAARGTSVITDNARWQCNLSTPSERQGYGPQERRRYVSLEFAKLNYEKPMIPRWLWRGDDGVLSKAERAPTRTRTATRENASLKKTRVAYIDEKLGIEAALA